jgi:hypothetical protein
MKYLPSILFEVDVISVYEMSTFDAISVYEILTFNIV